MRVREHVCACVCASVKCIITGNAFLTLMQAAPCHVLIRFSVDLKLFCSVF